ncbi:Spy/CpxP family protein refolding chaperone [Dysgonomonas sp. 520]|uniref:Spy/CpxP family protein refolding chaperone n=1 Tax=Dysgonomonas sp. 520 TaxID=2302931 RepID=UPI0013D211F2|nr:hypothetical protein [Dysgonomonas sp. 520]NDW09480.1 hypothetical protein [Dysgonomonas sp. 520]
MKKLFLFALIASVISVGSIAAQGNTKQKKGDGRRSVMKELNLTAEQQSKIEALNKDFKNKSDALKTQRKDLAKSHRESINSILTPEQQSLLKDKRKDRSEKMAKKGKDHKKFAKGKGNKRPHMKLDEATRNQLRALKNNYIQEKSAIKRSRIAPEVQAKQLEAAKEKFRTDRREIIQKSLKNGQGVKNDEKRQNS